MHSLRIPFLHVNSWKLDENDSYSMHPPLFHHDGVFKGHVIKSYILVSDPRNFIHILSVPYTACVELKTIHLVTLFKQYFPSIEARIVKD